MKLYYKPGACSLASHIVLTELGLAHEIEAVDTKAGKTETGDNYRAINPKGYVPTLRLDNSDLLTEGPAILQFLADSAPRAGLIPATGTIERARVLEMLTFVSSELHKAFGPLFRDDAGDGEKQAARDAVAGKFDHVESQLSDAGAALSGGPFTIADAYLFVVANWAKVTGIDLSRWPRLDAFVAGTAERPAVVAAMRAEGLIR